MFYVHCVLVILYYPKPKTKHHAVWTVPNSKRKIVEILQSIPLALILCMTAWLWHFSAKWPGQTSFMGPKEIHDKSTNTNSERWR